MSGIFTSLEHLLASIVDVFKSLFATAFSALESIFAIFASALQTVWSIITNVLGDIAGLLEGVVALVFCKYSLRAHPGLVGRIWHDANPYIAANLLIIGLAVAACFGYAVYRQNQGKPIAPAVQKKKA